MARRAPTVLLTLAAGLCAAAPARAQVIASWTFGTVNMPGVQTGPQFAPDTTNPNAAVTNVTSGSAANILIEVDSPVDGTTGMTYPTAPFLRAVTAGAASPDEATALANNTYWTITVTPNNGFRASLASLVFDVARGGGATPRGWYVYESVDGFTLGSALQSNPNDPDQRPTFGNVTVPLTAARFQNLTSPIEFRMYISTPATGQSLDFDNIVLNGTVAPVPEPSSLALVGLAVTGWAARRRWR
jgi:hypothetical protein